jgi:uncharacterized membrane protein YraQ (UPF0718 family)
MGPLVYLLALRRRWVLEGLDGLVLVSVGLLVGMHILPEAISIAGWSAALAALFGLAAPIALERLSGRSHENTHRMVIWIAMTGLAIHAAVDGMVLAGAHGHGHGEDHLAQAVILHRLPVGVALWWLVRPRAGLAAAGALLLTNGMATMVGFFLAVPLSAPLGSAGAAIFQAFVAGSLVHVLVHRLSDVRPAAPYRLAETLGAVLGLAIVLLPGFLTGHDFEASPYAQRLLSLALESAPALLLGYALAGIIKTFLPEAPLAWLGRGSAPTQAARGMAFGIPLPICSCGVVPIYQSLVERGVPTTAAMAFLVATPEIGVESALLSWSLLGGELTLARLAAAALVAFLAGWLIGRRVGPRPSSFAMAIPDGPSRGRGHGKRLLAALRYGFLDVVRDTAPWLVLGLVIAAALDPGSLGAAVGFLPRGLDVVFFALLGVPVYVCASAATPLGAAFLLVGVSPGAAIAFLLSGPATNVTTFGVLSNLHGRRIALLFGAFVLIVTVALGLAINLAFDGVKAPIANLARPEAAPLLHWLSLGAVGLSYLLALATVGPRAFLGTIFSMGRPQGRGQPANP